MRKNDRCRNDRSRFHCIWSVEVISEVYQFVLTLVLNTFSAGHAHLVYHIHKSLNCSADCMEKLSTSALYEVLPKISENINILGKALALRTCADRCLLLYLSTISQATCVFISARVSKFWLFSLHRFHVCLLISK